MKQSMVISAVGPDRPGLVDELTGFLVQQGANIADARMVNLRGQFAVIMLVEAPDSSAAAIRQAVPGAAERSGLTATVVPLSAERALTVQGVPYLLKVSAMDQPGIVHRITHLLHRMGINVEDLKTHLDAAAHSGTPLFSLELRMTVPPKVAVRQLRADLASLCDELNCDFELHPL
ncbi:MAG: hypothetical protein IT443_13610 [Phycisphaeraceae bacterium]|nr:hypothetical protein [Phycisphaeraceae bacterium]